MLACRINLLLVSKRRIYLLIVALLFFWIKDRVDKLLVSTWLLRSIFLNLGLELIKQGGVFPLINQVLLLEARHLIPDSLLLCLHAFGLQSGGFLLR